ncbi:MBL fold metallo-hydrolase [Aeromicrobium sp. UC242_57]|uniref:MBL fold metallo-hydrolase n=1 Tax=Aeromicrobium sp. UC242_57 TaxID=3374624 RepID=UPI0037AE8E1B
MRCCCAIPRRPRWSNFGDWTENADGQQTTVKGLSITGIGAQHAVILPTIPRIGNVGVLVTAAGEPTLFHPGDTYEHAPSDVDVLALPLSAPWAKSSETVDFIHRVSPRTLFPIHDCTTSPAGHGSYSGSSRRSRWRRRRPAARPD